MNLFVFYTNWNSERKYYFRKSFADGPLLALWQLNESSSYPIVVELSIEFTSNNFLCKSLFNKMQSSRFFFFYIIQFKFRCWSRLHHHSNSPVAQLCCIHIWLQFFSFFSHILYSSIYWTISVSLRVQFESLKERCYRILKGLR